MDGISRSRGWDKEIPHGVLPMEQLVLSDEWARKTFLTVIHQVRLSFVYLFDLILYVHSTIFQLCGTGLPGLNQY